MKKILQISTVFITVMLLGSGVFAQHQTVGDTLIISPVDTDGMPILGVLNTMIHGDTTAAGDRVHKVYKLHRNAQYVLTEPINADFPLVLVADDPDDENHPPVVRAGLTEAGDPVNRWWRVFDDATFKNLWITGVNLDGTGPLDWIAQEVFGTEKRITFEGCIIEYPFTWWAAFADWGGWNSYILTDNIFMNHGTPGTTWNGAIFHHMRTDSIIARNNTFFNFGAFAINSNESSAYVEVDHNTFVNSMVHPLNTHRGVEQYYTNNLFVNTHAFSDDKDEIMRHFDQEVKGIMNYAEVQWDPEELDELFGITQYELVWELRNNAWGYTDPIKAYWDEFEEVVPNPWMNEYNKAMFENQDGPWTWDLVEYEFEEVIDEIINGDTTWVEVVVDSTVFTMEHEPFQYFVEENTMNADPGFVDMMETDVLLAEAATNIRREWAGEDDVPHPNWHNVDDYLDFAGRWPLTFDLSYTNAELLTGSTRGFPVGDLNWFPDKKDEWLVSAEDHGIDQMPVGFSLSQAYPNPFNPVTQIMFSIPVSSDVRLEVYNLIGQRVAVLADGMMAEGSHTVQFNGANMASGVYIYRLQAGNKTAVRKMTLIK